jgi:hypothetical protein
MARSTVAAVVIELVVIELVIVDDGDHRRRELVREHVTRSRRVAGDVADELVAVIDAASVDLVSLVEYVGRRRVPRRRESNPAPSRDTMTSTACAPHIAPRRPARSLRSAVPPSSVDEVLRPNTSTVTDGTAEGDSPTLLPTFRSGARDESRRKSSRMYYFVRSFFVYFLVI